MPADNLTGIEPLIWAAVYARHMPSTSSLTREAFDLAMVDAECEADLHIERRRDREMARRGRPVAKAARTILEDIGFLPRRPDPEDEGDDDLNH